MKHQSGTWHFKTFSRRVLEKWSIHRSLEATITRQSTIFLSRSQRNLQRWTSSFLATYDGEGRPSDQRDYTDRSCVAGRHLPSFSRDSGILSPHSFEGCRVTRTAATSLQVLGSLSTAAASSHNTLGNLSLCLVGRCPIVFRRHVWWRGQTQRVYSTPTEAYCASSWESTVTCSYGEDLWKDSGFVITFKMTSFRYANTCHYKTVPCL